MSLKDQMQGSPHTALTELPRGEQARVETIQGRVNLMSRMASMGLTPGAEVTMVQNFRRTPLIVNVRYTLIALGRPEARSIYITR